jgi:hypothetical protein
MPRRTIQRAPGHRRAAAKATGRGTPADRLVRAWLDGGDDAFADLAEELIAGGRDGVLAAAVRKLAGRHEDGAVAEFIEALAELAEAAEGGDTFGYAELVLLPVLSEGRPPDPAPIAAGLVGSGAFPPEAEAAFADGWRSAEAIGALSPCGLRRVLADVATGREPADLPPLPPGGMADGGVAVLVGCLAFRSGRPGEDTDAAPGPAADGDGGDRPGSRRHGAFDRWRASLDPDAMRGVVVLPCCRPSALADEVRAFLLEAVEGLDPTLEEAVGFVEAARVEAGDAEEPVARLAAREGGVALAVLTRSGRVLDSRTFDLAGGGVTAEDVRRVVGAVMPIEDGPG